ncbi:MAG TPA: peptidase domain-containing ABC transporter [Polyangia bacterium]|nr:peptidase domain-containing ABC transporter [Polyangia bacterium]
MSHNAAPASAPDLEARYPALGRLAPRRRRRIPVMRQLSAAECGAACLAMVLGYYDKAVPLDEIRSVMGIGRDGATALAILNAASRYGLRGRGVKLDVDELHWLPAGTLLHWEFNHFVVFERLRGGFIEIVDPSSGRRRVSPEQLGRSFTGVALVLEPTDTFTPSAAGERPIWKQIRAIVADSGQWTRIIVVSLLLQLFALALPALTGTVVDRVVPRGEVHLLGILAVGMVGLVGFHFLASMVRAHLLIQLRTIFDARMTLSFLDHLLRLPYAYFQQRSAGDLMMRVNSNTSIRELLTSGLLSTALDGSLVVLYLGMIFIASPAFGAVVTLLAVAQLAVFLCSRRRQQDLMTDTLEKQARAESYLVELLAGVETLKASGSELRAGEHWSGLFVDQLNIALDRARLNAVVDSLNGALRIASPLVVLGFGAMQALDGTMTLGAVLALAALAGAFLGPLGNLVATATQLQLLWSYLERIEDVLGAAPEQPLDEARQIPTLRGRITLDDVSFRYTTTAPSVVRNVSLEIEAGDFVAIVGRSGSGKSTLASLLLGLYTPTAGRIAYDGADLAGLDARALRQQVGIVNQRAYLFGGTLRNNIAMGDPQLPLDQLVAAARRAEIHDEISAMPMGYDTLLIDGGASLSGGQRQRVALARALARQPAILLLDEATSALDAVTERAVQTQLAQLPCTRVVIAHRLSTIREADLILVMDDGRVVEQGTHAELLARGGAYARLISAQVEPAQ